MTWQTMETAPKDGTFILAFGDEVIGRPAIVWDTQKPRMKGYCVIRWVEGWYDRDEEVSQGLFRKLKTLGYAYWAPDPQQFTPTYWQPLPEKP